MTVTLDGDRVYVIDGHIRLLATMRAIEVYGAEIKGVPVQAEGRFKTEADRVLSQIVRKSGKPLTPMECGAVYIKLTAFGWTPEEIASKAGYTPLRVRRLIDLVEHATSRLKALVSSGQAATETAAMLLKSANGDADKVEQLLDAALDVAATDRSAKLLPKHVRAAPVPPPAKVTPGRTRARAREPMIPGRHCGRSSWRKALS